MSSGFITESEVLEQRRVRQEEWDKVRTEDQPKEAPEEAYADNRPLYQRLDEQKMKKEAEFEEAHKLKNMIRGLDDDEVGFLDLVEETKAKAAKQISAEERKEMQEFRERVSTVTESEEMMRLRAQIAPARTTQSVQPPKNKLQGVVVRKRKASDTDAEKTNGSGEPVQKLNGVNKTVSPNKAKPPVLTPARGGALTCIGVLPGLGHYDGTDTSTDSDSSDSDVIDKCCSKEDFLGRHPSHSDSEAKKKAEVKSS